MVLAKESRWLTGRAPCSPNVFACMWQGVDNVRMQNARALKLLILHVSTMSQQLVPMKGAEVDK